MISHFRIINIFLILFFVLSGFALPPNTFADNSAPMITKEELKPLLGNPRLILLDVRVQEDWTGSPFKIQGALREDPEEFMLWAKKYPKSKLIVLY